MARSSFTAAAFAALLLLCCAASTASARPLTLPKSQQASSENPLTADETVAVRRLLQRTSIGTLQQLSLNNAQGEIQSAVESNTPGATFYATNRAQNDAYLVNTGGSYALGGLTNARPQYPGSVYYRK